MRKSKKKSHPGKQQKPHAIDVSLGERIRELRHLREMTQMELAKQVGVRFQQVQKYETGFNRVSASRLYMIAEALDVEVIMEPVVVRDLAYLC